MRSLDSASSNRQGPLASQLGGPDGEAVSNDWRFYFDKAYRAWAATSEQLNLFDAPLDYTPRYTQIRDLPGETFEEIFRR